MTNSDHRTAVIVGGAGSMGRWAVRSIARLGSVDRLIIADLDVNRAQTLVDEVGGPCEAARLDATDEAAMRALFADCDVVLNTMGPFSIFAHPVLAAAIDSGCDYLDIDDDWESTLEAFELDAAAREKGLRVIKGIGGSPGYSNMCAMLAARDLDAVEEILTGWSLKGAVIVEEEAYPSGSASAAVEHWLIQVSGTIRTWREGGEKDVVPLEPVSFDYPGIGPVRGFTVGHPEAVTLPRYVPGVTRSTNVTSGPDWIFDHVRAVAADYDAGRISLEEGAALLNNPPQPAQRGPRDPLATCWAVAIGDRGNRRVAVSVEPLKPIPGKMGEGTGIPLAIGLDLLCRGRIKETGVNAPEGAIDPADFFEVYRQFVDLEDEQSPVVIRELLDPAPVEIG